MPPLPENLVRELCTAAVNAGLSREALLATIPPVVVGSLPKVGGPLAQLLMDLSALNQMGAIRDGTWPVRTWVENGVSLLTVQREGELFERALATLLEAIEGAGAPAPARPRAGRPHVLLFLTANPSSTTRLALGEEARQIDQDLRGARYREEVRVEIGHEVRPTDLIELLLRHTPDIVHFSGHGSAAGELAFSDADGRAATVQPSVLGRVFGALRDRPVRGVVLNACFSAAQADKILEKVEFVVGMSTAIKDSAAIRFAGVFYQTLAFGRNLQTAFDLARAQIDLASLGQGDVPQLLVRAGLRAADIYLIPPASTSST